MKQFGGNVTEISLTTFVTDLNLGMAPSSENYFSKQKGADNKEEYKEMECVICMDKKNEILLRPCNHTGFCKSCIIEQIKENNNCPICRKDIQKAYVIYFDE